MAREGRNLFLHCEYIQILAAISERCNYGESRCLVCAVVRVCGEEFRLCYPGAQIHVIHTEEVQVMVCLLNCVLPIPRLAQATGDSKSITGLQPARSSGLNRVKRKRTSLHSQPTSHFFRLHPDCSLGALPSIAVQRSPHSTLSWHS